jgi:hypothetical protein
MPHVVLGLLKSRSCRLIETIQHIKVDISRLRAAFPTTDIIEDTVDGLFRYVARDGRFGVGEELLVRLESLGLSM